MPHYAFIIRTNRKARKMAGLDIKIIECLTGKRSISLDELSSSMRIEQAELKAAFSRLEKVASLVKTEFRRKIALR